MVIYNANVAKKVLKKILIKDVGCDIHNYTINTYVCPHKMKDFLLINPFIKTYPFKVQKFSREQQKIIKDTIGFLLIPAQYVEFDVIYIDLVGFKVILRVNHKKMYKFWWKKMFVKLISFNDNLYHRHIKKGDSRCKSDYCITKRLIINNF